MSHIKYANVTYQNSSYAVSLTYSSQFNNSISDCQTCSAHTVAFTLFTFKKIYARSHNIIHGGCNA